MGNGNLYSSTDEDLINLFIQNLNSVKYRKSFNVSPTVGSKTYLLYNEKGQLITKISLLNNNTIMINDNYYKPSNSISLKKFSEDFFKDKNIIFE